MHRGAHVSAAQLHVQLLHRILVHHAPRQTPRQEYKLRRAKKEKTDGFKRAGKGLRGKKKLKLLTASVLEYVASVSGTSRNIPTQLFPVR